MCFEDYANIDAEVAITGELHIADHIRQLPKSNEEAQSDPDSDVEVVTELEPVSALDAAKGLHKFIRYMEAHGNSDQMQICDRTK